MASFHLWLINCFAASAFRLSRTEYDVFNLYNMLRLGGMVSSVITALLFAFPVGYLAKRNGARYGAVLPILFFFFLLFPFGRSSFDMAKSLSLEFLTLLVFSMLFSALGAIASNKLSAK
jgi:hypothetical protein